MVRMTCWPIGLLGDALDEVVGDIEVDVGLEQGTADLAQALADVGLGDSAPAAQLLQRLAEAALNAFEHSELDGFHLTCMRRSAEPPFGQSEHYRKKGFPVQPNHAVLARRHTSTLEWSHTPKGRVMAEPKPNHVVPPLTPEFVFQEYTPGIYNLARRMLGNDADAEDVTQNVLMQVVRKLDTFRGESAFPTWLHRVTVNAALSHRQKRASQEKNRIADPLDLFLENGSHGKPVKPWSILPEQEVLDRESQDLVEQAIAGLPEIYRDVYVLADVEELPNSEIAEMLSLSIPAVKSRLHRARLLLRDALAPHFEEALT